MAKMNLELTTKRIESLSDGVFAIAMTLLVLGLEVEQVPQGMPGNVLNEKLFGLWPDFLHFVQGFLITATFWIKHHQQFHFIKKADAMLVWINFIALMAICLVPFSTQVVGEYGHLRIAALIFEINMLLAGLAFYWHWQYATSNMRLVDPNLDPCVIKLYKMTNLVVPGVSIFAMLVTILFPRMGTVAYLAIPFVLLYFRKKCS